MNWSLIFWGQGQMVLQVYFDERGWQAHWLVEPEQQLETRGDTVYPPFSSFSIKPHFKFNGKNNSPLVPGRPLLTARARESWWLLSGVYHYDS